MARREPGQSRAARRKSATPTASSTKKQKAAGNRPATKGEEEAFVVWASKARAQNTHVRKAAEKLQTEKASLGGIYAAMRDGGFSAERVRILKRTIKEELRDPGERIAEAREMAWQAKALNSPMVQLGLFEGLLKAPSLPEYELQGEHAGRNGEPIDNAPGKPGSPEHTHYLAGWKRGQKTNADKLVEQMKGTPANDVVGDAGKAGPLN